VSARRLEFQRFEQRRRKFAQRQVAIRGVLQGIFAGEIGQFSNLSLDAQQLGPADG
jgi:hypothetical protein